MERAAAEKGRYGNERGGPLRNVVETFALRTGDVTTCAGSTIARDRDTATFAVLPLRPLRYEGTAALTQDGARLLAFGAAEATLSLDVRFLPPR